MMLKIFQVVIVHPQVPSDMSAEEIAIIKELKRRVIRRVVADAPKTWPGTQVTQWTEEGEIRMELPDAEAERFSREIVAKYDLVML